MSLMSLMIFVEKQESRKSCDDFCWEAGIKKELIVPYNPQQNGVAERMNRTICEAAKTMITHLNLPVSSSVRILHHTKKQQVNRYGLMPWLKSTVQS